MPARPTPKSAPRACNPFAAAMKKPIATETAPNAKAAIARAGSAQHHRAAGQLVEGELDHRVSDRPADDEGEGAGQKPRHQSDIARRVEQFGQNQLDIGLGTVAQRGAGEHERGRDEGELHRRVDDRVTHRLAHRARDREVEQDGGQHQRDRKLEPAQDHDIDEGADEKRASADANDAPASDRIPPWAISYFAGAAALRRLANRMTA